MASRKKSENSSQDSVNKELVAAQPQSETDANLIEVIEGLPAERRAEVMRVISQHESHSGWLPTPNFLSQYNKILPGLAERIVAMPEREQAHRHRVVERMVTDDFAHKKRGQTLAMASLVLLLAVSIGLIALGQFAWGARIAIFGIVGVVGIFVTGKWADAKAGKASEIEEDEDN